MAQDELFESLEQATRQLLAVEARCDDFRVENAFSYLEEMARNFTTSLGCQYWGVNDYDESSAIVYRQDKWLKSSVILANNRIGDHLEAYGIRKRGSAILWQHH